MSEQDVVVFVWDSYISVTILTLISYDYLLLFEKEVEFLWKRQWTLMSCLYFIVRYLGLFLALVSGCSGGLLYIPEAVSYALSVLMEWGFSVYFWFAEAILIWRLCALYNQSKRLLYVLLATFLPIVALEIGTDIYLYSRRSAYSVTEIVLVTPDVKYCMMSFKLGPMIAVYTSIPIICYDIFLVILAAVILVKHLKERTTVRLKPNAYVMMIVRYHIIYFVLNLTNQILLVVLWTGIPAPARSFLELFVSCAPFILAPRLIINIWDTHAHSECAHVSTMFEDCVCWTLPPISEEHEMDSQIII
ncbi:hypothetical protein M405DRAFT_290077 [Rhizopogon salebrosus TDB-379]|nr:hypothetical protein M405DRAFT_290077 [Rhizopogon salebrosus TDB-379]